MSLMSDKDHLILSLRLAYLRYVDDHVGPRVISVPDIVNLPLRPGQPARWEPQDHQRRRSRYRSTQPSGSSSLGIEGIPQPSSSSDQYDQGEVALGDSVIPPYARDSPVVLAGLNDARKHPELTTLYSPVLHTGHGIQANNLLHHHDAVERLEGTMGESSRARAASLGAAGLKHTTTIYGPGRTGALGMRVTGRTNTNLGARRGKARRAESETGTAEEGRTTWQAKRSGSARSPSRDSPSRGRVSERSATSSEGMTQDGDTTQSTEAAPIPQLAIQTSTYDSDPTSATLANKRSKSLRIAAAPGVSLSSQSSPGQDAVSRHRSSSQPHKPALPSNLSTAAVVRDEENESPPKPYGLALPARNNDAQTTALDVNEAGLAISPVRSTQPPPRPPRKARTSISEQSSQSTQSSPVAPSSKNGPQTGDLFDSPQPMPGRRRSRSEAIMPAVAKTPRRPTMTDEAASADGDSRRRERDLTTQPYLDRTQSDSTIFSLESPRARRPRGLSLRSQQSDLSTRSNEISSDRQSQPTHTFAPVAEDPEFGGQDSLDGDSLSISPTTRTRALSDPRERSMAPDSYLLSPFGAARRRSKRDMEVAEGEVTLDGEEIDAVPGETVTPMTMEATSSEPLAAPIEGAGLDLEHGLSGSALTPGLASVGPDEALDSKGTKHKTLRTPEPSRTTPATFAKVDPRTLKRRFEQRSARSGLTALISHRSERPDNPFDQLYKGVAGSTVSDGASIVIEMLFPFAAAVQPVPPAGPTQSGALALHPTTRSMRLSVRKDATMEEVIGYSLYCFVEEGWSPRLDETLPADASDELRAIRLSTLAWTLRLVEDGEVDDDYPALDRLLTVGKFGADEFAVCEATAAQIKQNQSASALQDRRISRQRQKQAPPVSTQPRTAKPGQTLRLPTLDGRSTSTASLTPRAGTVVHVGSATALSVAGDRQGMSLSDNLAQDTPLFPASLLGLRRDVENGSTSSPAPTSGQAASYQLPIFLRILVTPNSEVRYKTTLQVTKERYLADVLETICKRRDLGSADKWALLVPDKDIVVPLDRTVESLQGNYDLALVRRQDLGAQHSGAFSTQSTNPNASIFKRISQPEPRYQAAAKEMGTVYRSYTVNRRMPTFLGKSERTLTIDGDWLHIIPTDTRAYQSHTATTSYPIASIVSCASTRLPSSFKVVVSRQNDQKRYDFEAENAKVAAEIVQVINASLTAKASAQQGSASVGATRR